MSKKVSGWPLIAPKTLPEGLPAYTDADADKMLIVGADETDVVPQQTVTASELGGADLEGFVAELFIPGAAVKVTMDGFTYPIVAVTEETVTTPQGDVTYYEALFSKANTYAIQYYPDDEAAGLTITSGTHTIEAVAMDVRGPAWVDQPVEPEYVIPEITEQDVGKVLTAGEGEPVWVESSGGFIDMYLGSINSSQQYKPSHITHKVFYNAVTDAIQNKKTIRLHPHAADVTPANDHSAFYSVYLDNYSSNCIFGVRLSQATSSGPLNFSWIEAYAQSSTPDAQQTFQYKSINVTPAS